MLIPAENFLYLRRFAFRLGDEAEVVGEAVRLLALFVRVEGAPAATAAVADVIGHGKEVRLLTEQDVPEQEKVSYIAVCGRAAEIRQGIQESGHGLEQFFHRFTAAESGRTETHLFLAVRSQRGDILRSAFTYHFLHGKNLFDLLSSTLQRTKEAETSETGASGPKAMRWAARRAPTCPAFSAVPPGRR